MPKCHGCSEDFFIFFREQVGETVIYQWVETIREFLQNMRAPSPEPEDKSKSPSPVDMTRVCAFELQLLNCTEILLTLLYV